MECGVQGEGGRGGGVWGGGGGVWDAGRGVWGAGGERKDEILITKSISRVSYRGGAHWDSPTQPEFPPQKKS